MTFVVVVQGLKPSANRGRFAAPVRRAPIRLASRRSAFAQGRLSLRSVLAQGRLWLLPLPRFAGHEGWSVRRSVGRVPFDSSRLRHEAPPPRPAAARKALRADFYGTTKVKIIHFMKGRAMLSAGVKIDPPEEGAAN